MRAEEFVALRESHGGTARKIQDGWMVTCGAHEDRTPSLHVTEGNDGRVLLHCQTGTCAVEDVLAADGLTKADLFDRHTNGHREIVETYPYTDEYGSALFEVVRFAPKDFRQRRPDGTWSLNGVRRVPYRLPKVLEAVEASQRVWIVEGERDVHALEKAGQVATCNPGGAGKWRDQYSAVLAGAHVVIVADNDEPGEKHALAVKASVEKHARKVTIVKAAQGKDAHDHLAAGLALREFVPWTAPEVEAAAPPADVDGGQLLASLRAFIERYMVLPSGEVADLLALWIVHTWTFTAAWATPYLRIVSATPECGKTLLLELLAALSRNGWHAVNPSPAVLYRRVHAQTPTLLLDEIDNFPLDDKRDALAVLNAGYKRGATVDRCKENGDLQSFNCFCPKAYAGLDTRSMVPALLSRSVTIRLERKARSENVERWLAQFTAPAAAALRDECSAWAHHHVEALNDATPDLPDELSDRGCEVWWALLAIADHVGGDWPTRARAAARVLSAGGDAVDEAPIHEQLLSDIRNAFDGETIFTKDLLAKLNADDEGPWKARRNGDGLDARGLGKMLRPFQIKPRSVRVPGVAGTSKGYHVDQFTDAFSRYLPQAAQAAQAAHRSPHGKGDVPDVPDVPDTTGYAGSGENGHRPPCSCVDGGSGDDPQCERCFGWRS
jgi:5S rRNA maturation endonuclease (ribonuclease M5)